MRSITLKFDQQYLENSEIYLPNFVKFNINQQQGRQIAFCERCGQLIGSVGMRTNNALQSHL